jgi:hypothetical protein
MANAVFIGNITQRWSDFRQTQAYLNWIASGGTGNIPDYVMKKAKEELSAKKEAELKNKEKIRQAVIFTEAYKSWLNSGGKPGLLSDIPEYVFEKAEVEIKKLIEQGYSIDDILMWKHLSKEQPENTVDNSDDNGGNAGGPNKMLLIGGAIAAAALLVLILRK